MSVKKIIVRSIVHNRSRVIIVDRNATSKGKLLGTPSQETDVRFPRKQVNQTGKQFFINVNSEFD